MEIAPIKTPKSTAKGNEERKLAKFMLNGDGAWFMRLASTTSKRSHQSTPSASPVRSARPAVLGLPCWSAPKMRPKTPPSTIRRRKPAQWAIVGLVVMKPNQRKTDGKPFPGAPSVTKSNRASTRLAKIPARSPLRRISKRCIVFPSLSLMLHEPARDARYPVVLPCRLQSRRQPEIDPEPASRRHSHQDECQQHQHAIRPDPLGIGQAHVQLHGKDGRQDGPETGEESEEQADGHQQFSRPDTGRQGHKCCAAHR